MATTTNFGWETPDDTDLVKDGALAIRTLGNSIDTSLVDLKGGTTGQVLSKTSNTDMDFTWVTSDDANAIQNAIVDAKGDLIAASAADTPARLAVGNNGETLVADSSASTGLRWQPVGGARNALINGAMDYWQRGTSFTAAGYTADRFTYYGGSFGTKTISRQTVAGVSGIPNDIRYALRYNCTVAGSGYFAQFIENGAGFGSGQTVTLSFYARNNGASTLTFGWELTQYFGTGGSPSSTVIIYSNSAPSIPASSTFARYQTTFTVPSVAGKTFGTNNDDNMTVRFYDIGVANLDITGIQLEVGSVATPFVRAGGTLAGELSACQRYYYRSTDGTTADVLLNSGMATSTTEIICSVAFPTFMRTKPSVLESINVRLYDNVNVFTPSAAVLGGSTSFIGQVVYTVTGATAFRPYKVIGNSGSSYIGFSAEL